jgi:hypothetical protein
VGRGDDGEIDREGDDCDAGEKHEVRKQVSKSAMLDHGA